MKTIRIWALILAALGSVAPLSAKEEGQKLLGFADQDWFAYLALGWGGIKYPEDFQKSLDALNRGDRIGIALDILGFYWPVLDKKAAIGFVASATGESYRYGLLNLSYLQISQTLYSFSTWYSPFAPLGDGLMLRGDIGLVNTVVLDSSDTNRSGISSPGAGFGALLGLGYPIGSGPDWRFLPNLNVSMKSVGGQVYSSFALQAGLMW